jgi:glycosyltransferase involved in cell wall biosynthesis
MNEKSTIPIEHLNVLISGLVLTSRTETIEDYLRTRVARLGVVGLAGPFQKGAQGRYTEYTHGQKKEEIQLSGQHVPNANSVAGSCQLILAFGWYVWNIFRQGWRHRPWDVFIGISCFSALVGVVLKKMGATRQLIYYSIDYYPTPTKWGFARMMVWAFRWADRICARNSDRVWHITNRIIEARATLGGLKADRYLHVEMPLSYRQSLMRRYPVGSMERWTIGFVGSLTESQGVQLLIAALPELARRFPELKVRIIGRGPYARELEALVEKSGQSNRVIFHGFIRDEEEVLDIIAHCAVAVAPWTQTSDNNILYADPGKPKLYMCLGVPCVITRGPDIATMVEGHGAGRAIDYTVSELVTALDSLMSDDGILQQARDQAYELGHEFVSEKIIRDALAKTFPR